jgi:K+-sensing histidine kinase KdpD
MVTISETENAPFTAAESFKPFARSLSHELRTPMHGVIGMLDVMHATVKEAIESQHNVKLRNIFQALKENIEVVQGILADVIAFGTELTLEQTVLVEQ